MSKRTSTVQRAATSIAVSRRTRLPSLTIVQLPIGDLRPDPFNPRRMSDIMAQMQPDMAERLTVELANRGTGADRGQPAAALPKIEGRPR